MEISRLNVVSAEDRSVSGEFVDMKGERYYAIKNVDEMAPFFISVISDSDHWMFISSTGGMTAGRVSARDGNLPVHHGRQDSRQREPYRQQNIAACGSPEATVASGNPSIVNRTVLFRSVATSTRACLATSSASKK